MTHSYNDHDELPNELSMTEGEKVYMCHTYDIDGTNIDEVALFSTLDGARSHYRTELIDTLIWSLCNDKHDSIDDAYSYLDAMSDDQLYEIWMNDGDINRQLCYREVAVQS